MGAVVNPKDDFNDNSHLLIPKLLQISGFSLTRCHLPHTHAALHTSLAFKY